MIKAGYIASLDRAQLIADQTEKATQVLGEATTSGGVFLQRVVGRWPHGSDASPPRDSTVRSRSGIHRRSRGCPVAARDQQRDYLSKPSYLRNSASPISPSPSPYSRRRFMAAAPAKTHTTARTANTPNPMYMSRRLSPPSPVESTLNGTRRGPPRCGFRGFDGLATTFDRRTLASRTVVHVRGRCSWSSERQAERRTAPTRGAANNAPSRMASQRQVPRAAHARTQSGALPRAE